MTREPAKTGGTAGGSGSKESLEELLRRKAELENMAQAYAIAGLEMPAGTEEEYVRLKARIEELQR